MGKKDPIPLNHIKGGGAVESSEAILFAIKQIIDRGNNAEVRKAKDGSVTVYEVKKNIVSVR